MAKWGILDGQRICFLELSKDSGMYPSNVLRVEDASLKAPSLWSFIIPRVLGRSFLGFFLNSVLITLGFAQLRQYPVSLQLRHGTRIQLFQMRA